MGWLKGLVQSRKFWLTVGACVAAAVTSNAASIPTIIMVNAGLIAAEDAAAKVKGTAPAD